jgi:hypothetical protein
LASKTIARTLSALVCAVFVESDLTVAAIVGVGASHAVRQSLSAHFTLIRTSVKIEIVSEALGTNARSVTLNASSLRASQTLLSVCRIQIIPIETLETFEAVHAFEAILNGSVTGSTVGSVFVKTRSAEFACRS